MKASRALYLNFLFALTVAGPFSSSQSWAFDTVKKSNQSSPDIGLNITFLGQAASSQSEYDNGFTFEELELSLSAAVDPYWSGQALLAVHREVSDDPLEPHAEYALEPEEIYFENLTLPHIALRVGKQKMYFGKLNHIHLHAQPFVDEPFTISRLLGEEGFNETGISASYLLPTSWYSEAIYQGGSGENENLFHSSKKGDLFHAVYFKNLWDMASSATFEWILSGATGQNSGDKTTNAYNTAVTYKWRPKVDGINRSFAATAEFTQIDRKQFMDENQTLYSLDPESAQAYWFRYQFHREWAAGLRYEYAKSYQIEDLSQMRKEERRSAVFTYSPSEFSQAQLQYDQTRHSQSDDLEHRAVLKLNFSMGAHPTHSY